MQAESAPNRQGAIQNTIINVSFPRSGHRFLREILSGYFAEDFVFYESYTKKVKSRSQRKNDLQFVNYVKTHDFQLRGREVLIKRFPVNRMYLVQIRHPLESIASYYEFSLKHGDIRWDREKSWNRFLNKKIKYWRRFCEIWLSDRSSDLMVVGYENLCCETFDTARKAIDFLTNGSELNSERLIKVIEHQDFLQYVGEPGSKKSGKRKLESFKYFDREKFEKIEQNLLKTVDKSLGFNMLHR